MIDIIFEWLAEHWMRALVFGVLTLSSSWLGGYLSLRAWRKHKFYHRVNVSLNYISNDTLKIRTLFETDLSNILLNNPAAVKIVTRAAKRTTPDNPFLMFSSEDNWYILNAVLNEIAERFQVGTMKASVDAYSSHIINVRFALTCEKDDDVKLHKIRILVISEKECSNIYKDKVQNIQFESEHHHVRWETLNKMIKGNYGAKMEIAL